MSGPEVSDPEVSDPDASDQRCQIQIMRCPLSGVADNYDLPDVRAGSQTPGFKASLITFQAAEFPLLVFPRGKLSPAKETLPSTSF